MASSSSTPTVEAANVAPIPDDDHTPDLPLTMSASVVLTSLPRDAHAALSDAGALEQKKGIYPLPIIPPPPSLSLHPIPHNPSSNLLTVFAD